MRKLIDAIRLSKTKYRSLVEREKDLSEYYFGRVPRWFYKFTTLYILIFTFLAGVVSAREYFMRELTERTNSFSAEVGGTVTLTYEWDTFLDLFGGTELYANFRSFMILLIILICSILILNVISFVILSNVHKKELDEMMCELDYPKLINSWEVEYIFIDSVKYEIKAMDDEGVLICEPIEEAVHE